ncbi:MAG: hypothetical protein GX649_01375 [Chloroflexi bacterium]|nr:hypothetical protein [Chloroflexota bacterium]
MNRRLITLVSLFLVLVLSLSGCGGGGDEPEPTLAPTTASAPATAAPASPTTESTRVPPASVPTAAQPTAEAPEPTAEPEPQAEVEPTAKPEDAEPTAEAGAEPEPTAEAGSAGEQPAAAEGSEAEPNDTEAQANPLTSGTWEGTLAEGDADWFEIPLPAGALVNITLSAGNNANPLSIAVYDAAEDHLWSESAVGKGQAVQYTRIVGPEDTLYVELDGGTGDYTIEVALDTQDDAGSGGDAGDAITDATEIAPTGTFEGIAGDGDAEDWYTLDLPDGAVLDLAFTPAEDAEGLAVIVLDPDQDEMWSAYDVSVRGESLHWVFSGEDGGPYYVQVFLGRGAYTLDVTTATQDDGETGADAPGELRDAVEVTVDEPLVGVVGNSDREDWYLFSVDPGTVLTVDVALGSEAEEINAFLYDPDESEVWREYDISPRQGASVTRSIAAEAAGEYALGVSGTGAYTVTISSAGQNDAGSGGDAGEEIYDAVEVEVGETLQGLQGDTDYADWYTFEVPGGSVLTVTVTPDRGTDGLGASLLDPDESELWADYGLRGGREATGSAIIGPADGGAHYLYLFSGSGSYTFVVDVTSQDDAGSGGDAGDESLDAVEIEVGQEYAGIQGGSDRTDWYVLTIEDGETVTITLAPARGDQNLYLSVYDADENEIETVWSIGGGREGSVTIDGAAAGEYYVEVGGGQGEYALVVE